MSLLALNGLRVNSVTGKTVVNRVVFQDLGTRVEATGEFTEALVSFQFMGTSPGECLVLHEVGRTVFSPEDEFLLRGGQHNVPDGPESDAVSLRRPQLTTASYLAIGRVAAAHAVTR